MTEISAEPRLVWERMLWTPGMARRASSAGRVTCTVTEASAAVLGLQLRPRSPFSADTLFDGIDFAALAGAAPEDGDPIELIADEDAANRLKRALQNHDFYFVNPRDSAP